MTLHPPTRRAVAIASFLFVSCLAIASGRSQEPTLDPTTWPAAERHGYERLGLSTREPARSYEDVVVLGTSCPFALRAGYRALERGGSAMDAAITVSLAQVARAMGSWNSYAGIFHALYYEASTQTVHALNASFQTVLAETDPQSIPKPPEPSGRTALVPGFWRGVEVAHRAFGMLAWKELIEPALFLAEEGFELDAGLAATIRSHERVLARRGETLTAFTKPDGSWLRVGDHVTQPALAKTLRRIADQGAAYVYEGPWAERFVEAVREEGGRITRDDLTRYEAHWETPLTTTYAGGIVHGLAAPELGSIQLLESLNILRSMRFEKAQHYTESPVALATLLRVSRLGQLVSYTPGAFEPFVERAAAPRTIRVPERLSPAWTDACIRTLREPDWERRFHGELVERFNHSDANVVVDRAGNVAVVLHSVNALLYGATGLYVDGFSIPDAGALQQTMIERAGPGRRLPNMTNPVIVLRDGQPIYASCAIGSSLHECTLAGLIDVLQFGMHPGDAVKEPAFLGSIWRRTPARDPASFPMGVVEGTFDEELLAAVRAQGIALDELSPRELGLRRSVLVGVLFEPGTGRLLPGAHRGWAEGR